MDSRNQQHRSLTWWGPVWRGLVVDPTGQHYRKMNGAIWLFLSLVLHADRKTGEVRRRYATIAGEMGVNVRTIRRWRQRLEQNGYITVRRTGHSYVIHIQRWKPVLSMSKADASATESGTN